MSDDQKNIETEDQLAVERWAQSDPILQAWVKSNPNVPLVRTIKETLRFLRGPCSDSTEMNKRLEQLGVDACRAAGAGIITDEEDLADARLGEFTTDLDRMERTIRHLWKERDALRHGAEILPPTDENPGVDPTNASLAAQNRKILQGLARLEKLIEDPSPTPLEIANKIEAILRGAFAELTTAKDAETLAMAIEAVGTLLDRLVIDIRCPRGTAPSESAEPEAELEAKEPPGPVVDYIPVSWEEYGKRINASVAKCAEADRKAEMIDAVMAAGMLAISENGNAALALGELIATMIPEGGPMREIPEGWAPVLLAINPMTGEFLPILGPRSGPGGRVEPLETMLARQFKGTIANVIGAVREVGRPQPKPSDEAQPQPNSGIADCQGHLVVTGPIDEWTCEQCKCLIGDSVKPDVTAEYLAEAQRLCECENGCRLLVTHPDELDADDKEDPCSTTTKT